MVRLCKTSQHKRKTHRGAPSSFDFDRDYPTPVTIKIHIDGNRLNFKSSRILRDLNSFIKFSNFEEKIEWRRFNRNLSWPMKVKFFSWFTKINIWAPRSLLNSGLLYSFKIKLVSKKPHFIDSILTQKLLQVYYVNCRKIKKSKESVTGKLYLTKAL